MNNPLKSKIALVTGASRGIGRAIAAKLAAEGASVAINYSRDAAGAEEAVAAIKSAGGEAFAIQADIGSVPEITKMFDDTIAHFGKLDVLVNNAGVMFTKSVAETTEEDFDRIFGINVKGVFFACREASTRLADGGRIINLSSSTTARLMQNYGAYVATKGAVEQMTRSLAKELGARKITVNAISPGPVGTELFTKGKTPEQIQFFASQAALNRLGEPEDIANVVAFLASDASGWISGQNLRANGGLA